MGGVEVESMEQASHAGGVKLPVAGKAHHNCLQRYLGPELLTNENQRVSCSSSKRTP